MPAPAAQIHQAGTARIGHIRYIFTGHQKTYVFRNVQKLMDPPVDFRLISSDPRHFTAGKHCTDFRTGQLEQTGVVNRQFIADGTVAGILPHDGGQQRMTADIHRYDARALGCNGHRFDMIRWIIPQQFMDDGERVVSKFLRILFNEAVAEKNKMIFPAA